MNILVKAFHDWFENFMTSIPAFDLSAFDLSEPGGHWMETHPSRHQ